MTKEVPIWEKSNLTLEEASEYYNIGVKKLKELNKNSELKTVRNNFLSLATLQILNVFLPLFVLLSYINLYIHLMLI